jgi:hypothetical protein
MGCQSSKKERMDQKIIEESSGLINQAQLDNIYMSYNFTQNEVLTLIDEYKKICINPNGLITLDNLIRLIPGGKGTGVDNGEPEEVICHIQAFSLTFLDKLMLVLMTSYSIINYLGSSKLQFYRKNLKYIFIILTVVSIIISLISTLLFYLKGISNRSEYCYVETKQEFKQILDTIITSILLLISLFCIIKILINIYRLKKERENDTSQGIETIKSHFCRFIVHFIISFITFTYVILLILKQIPFDNFAKDLIYVLLSLIVELFFTVNSELIREIIRILTCSGNYDDDNNTNEGDETQRETLTNLREEEEDD